MHAQQLVLSDPNSAIMFWVHASNTCREGLLPCRLIHIQCCSSLWEMLRLIIDASMTTQYDLACRMAVQALRNVLPAQAAGMLQWLADQLLAASVNWATCVSHTVELEGARSDAFLFAGVYLKMSAKSAMQHTKCSLSCHCLLADDPG